MPTKPATMNLNVTGTAQALSTQRLARCGRKGGEALGSGSGDQVQISAGELDCLTCPAGTLGMAGRRVERGVPRGAASGLNDSLWNAGDHEHDTGGAAKTRRGALDAVILEDNCRGHGDPLGQLSPSTRSGPLVAVVTLALCRRWVRITGQTTSAAFALPIHSPGMMRTIDSRASRLRQKLARHSAGQHDPRARHSQSDSWAG
jgi:hypothetical protein